LGLPISYDVEFGDWQPVEPTGNLSMANCACGTTLALSSEYMPLVQIWQVLNWIKIETKRRGCDEREVMGYLRAQVMELALVE